MRDRRIYELIGEDEAELIKEGFYNFGAGAEISPQEQERILSSVMRKAGIEMKENTAVRKTKKHRKGFAGIVLAAALLITGAVGAGAYALYSQGFLNGTRALYPDTELNGKELSGLARVTSQWNGEITEDTFEDLDFTVEGTVNDGLRRCVILTVSRKDGSPFVLEEGEHYYFKYGGGAVPAGDPDHPEPDPGYREYKTQLNDDGTLTVIMYHTWIKDDGRYQARLTQLYKSAMSEEYFDGVLAEAALPCLKDVTETADGKPTAAHDADYQDAIDEVATEKFDGVLTFTYELETAEGPIRIAPEDNEFGYDITIGAMYIEGEVKGDAFAGSMDTDALDDRITVYLADGSNFTMETHGGWSTDEFGNCYMSRFGCEYPRPIRIDEVLAVEINGDRIDIR
ncbi:MAG: hypothetical protein IJ806_06425 [Ruminococcus sp.]|nr:hypothetical protein [Ruminococcus sp.]